MLPIRFIGFLVVTASLSAQATLIVDATGRNGQYRTIGAAVTAAKNGDLIVIHPSVYKESITLNKKAVSLLGFTGLAKDVTVQASGAKYVISMTGHPSGFRSRIRSLTLVSGSLLESIVLKNNAGDLFVEDVKAYASVTIDTWKGTLSFANCTVDPPGFPLSIRYTHILFAQSVQDLFIRDSYLRARFQSFQPYWLAVGVTVRSSRLEMTGTTVHGPAAFPGGSRYPTNGEYALSLGGASARISGDINDIIQGGASNGLNRSAGGTGLVVYNSKVDWSGVSILGGSPSSGGIPGQPFSIIGSSKVTKVKPTIPVIDIRNQNPRGTQTAFDIRAWPRAVSLTWLSPSIKPVPTALGVLAIDFAQPHFSIFLTHDAQGKATIPVDLRSYSASLRGQEYAVQTFAVSTANEPVLSTPFVGVLN